MDLLARREHSRLERGRKRHARAYTPEIAAEVLDALEEEGLLEESRFVESFVRSRVGKGQGPARIRAELLQRGVDDALIQTGLGEADYDWISLAVAARRKRFGADSPSDFAERARQARFLQSRGFDGGQIQAALDLGADSD